MPRTSTSWWCWALPSWAARLTRRGTRWNGLSRPFAATPSRSYWGTKWKFSLPPLVIRPWSPASPRRPGTNDQGPGTKDEGQVVKAYRTARVAEVIREVASETILFEVRDPRVKGVTVTRAEVSADLQHAKVYVSIMGSEKEQTLCLHGLRHSTGFIQSKLAGRLQTRFTPLVQFILDRGVKNSIEVSRLINEALAPPRSNADPANGMAEEESADS